MKALTLPLFLLLGCSLSAAAAETPPAHLGWHSQVDVAQAEARAADRFILVDLYADWCGWCRKLEREVFSDPSFIEFAKPFVKLRVNVEDGGQGEELQARYQAASLPTLLVLSPRMALAGTVEGYAPKSSYIRRIADVVERYRREVESYDQLLDTKDLRVLEQVAGQLHSRGEGARAAKAYQRLLDAPRQAPEDRPRHLYLLADALRLDQDFEGADRALTEGKRRALQVGDAELVEACDLLQIRLAQDRGGCADLVAALEQFVSKHPESRHFQMAKQSLREISRSPDSICT